MSLKDNLSIIDAHLHLDLEKYADVRLAARALSDELAAADVERGLVLHLEHQGVNGADFAAAIQENDRLEAFFNIDPHSGSAKEDLVHAIQELGFCGLKLHPRIQKFDLRNQAVIDLIRLAGTNGVPTLIDAFPDGSALMNGFNPLDFSYVAQKCPESKIIIAHMGGHYVLDMMFLAKRLPNVYFDFSYSLLYYRGSSIPQNMVYAMKSMKCEKIFFGSDYPDRTIKEAIDESKKILMLHDVSDKEMMKLFYTNIKEFMTW